MRGERELRQFVLADSAMKSVNQANYTDSPLARLSDLSWR